MDVEQHRIVILGGGMVAGYAAKELAGAGLKSGELGIVSADSALPYERPPLSKSFLAGKDDEQSVLINGESFYREHDIGIHLNTEVDRIDVVGHDRGSPSTRSAMMLRWISLVPPGIVAPNVRRYCIGHGPPK